MNRLDIIWTDIGLGEEQKCTRTKVVFEHMQTLLDDMATEEELCRTKLKDSMNEHLTEYTKLCSELHVEMVEVSLCSISYMWISLFFVQMHWYTTLL